MNNISDRIKCHPFMKGFADKHIEIAATQAVETHFKTGEVLFRENEPANKFYLVESGAIAIEAHDCRLGDCKVEVVHGGDVVGWSWLFPPFSWHFQARALQPTVALVLNGGHLLVASEEDHEFGYQLLKRVAGIVIHRLQSARKRAIERAQEEALHD